MALDASISPKSFDSPNGLLAGACGARGGEESSSNGFPDSSKGLLAELVLLGGAEGGGGVKDGFDGVAEFRWADLVAAVVAAAVVVVVVLVAADTDLGISEKPLPAAAGFSTFTPPCFSKSWTR